MRVLVCGSRQWHDRPTIRAVLVDLQRKAAEAGVEFIVIHGACPDGADLIADEICTSELGLIPGETLHRVPADWRRYGRAAGSIRNQRMIDQHDPTAVYAFRYGVKSNGTDDMVKRARRAKIPTQVIHPKPVRIGENIPEPEFKPVTDEEVAEVFGVTRVPRRTNGA